MMHIYVLSNLFISIQCSLIWYKKDAFYFTMRLSSFLICAPKPRARFPELSQSGQAIVVELLMTVALLR